MLIVLHLLALFSSVLCEIYQFSSDTLTYSVFYGVEHETSVYAATERCKEEGGKLADIPEFKTFALFNKTLSMELPQVKVFYIDTWQNDDYYPYCLAFYPGAMVNQPENGCEGPHPFICQSNKKA